MQRRITPQKKPKNVKSRELPLNERSLIVYKKPRSMDEEAFTNFLNAAARDILARFGISRAIIGVSEWSELRLLSDEQLDDLELCRKKDVFLMKKDFDLSQYSEDDIRTILEAYVISGTDSHIGIEEEE
ncbi:MAG: hypothetical protein ACWGQW_02600 [bacterium]